MAVNIEEYRENWMKFYLSMMLLRSKDQRQQALLEAIRQDSAEYNEKIMKFFVDMEAKT
jgi:hypothetical protein